MLLYCSSTNSPVWPGVQWGLEAAINLHSVLPGSSHWILLRRTTLRQVIKTPSLLNECWIKSPTHGKANAFKSLCPVCKFVNFPSVCSGVIIWFPTPRFGRKPLLYATMAVQVLSNFLEIFSPSWTVFSIFLFINGLGQISNFVAGFVLGKYKMWTWQNILFSSLWIWIICMMPIVITMHLSLFYCYYAGTEILTGEVRVLFSSLGVCVAFAIGYMMLPLFAFFLRTWKSLLLGIAFPGLVYIPLWW